MSQKITVIKNGPLVLEGIKSLITQDGKTLEIDETQTEICRCGNSFSMPFCDGNHIIFEFDDEEQRITLPEHIETYEGETLTVILDHNLCSHRGICYETLPHVFTMKSGHAILPDLDTANAIIDVCKRCPSGALSYQLKNGAIKNEPLNSNAAIKIAQRHYGFDGPLEVTHIPLAYEGPHLHYHPTHYVLCRCGQSSNMPFCNGNHFKFKFLDDSNDET